MNFFSASCLRTEDSGCIKCLTYESLTFLKSEKNLKELKEAFECSICCIYFVVQGEICSVCDVIIWIERSLSLPQCCWRVDPWRVLCRASISQKLVESNPNQYPTPVTSVVVIKFESLIWKLWCHVIRQVLNLLFIDNIADKVDWIKNLEYFQYISRCQICCNELRASFHHLYADSMPWK